MREKLQEQERIFLQMLDKPSIQEKLLEVLLNSSAFSTRVLRILNTVPKETKIQDSTPVESATLKNLRNQLAAREQDLTNMRKVWNDAELLRKEAEMKNVVLEKEIAHLKGEIAECQNTRNQLLQELQQSQKTLEQTREEANRINDQVSPFKAVLESYEQYKELCANDPFLSAVLPVDSPVRFFVAGTQRTEIFRLWDELSGRIETKSQAEQESWQKLLQFLLEQYNGLYQSPVLELMLDEQGKTYDRERHQGTANCSRYQGMIEKVLLPGIWNIRRNSAERKCVVCY